MFGFGVGVFLVIILIIVIIFASCIKIVPQAYAYVVERLGAYQQTLPVGFHVIMPVVDKVAKRVVLKEQVVDFAPQPVITKDNVTMRIDTVVFYQITDPKLFAYGVENPIMAIENLTATTLRNMIGEMELDQTLTSREIINTKMRASLDIATDPWGIKVNRVELKNIIPPAAIQDAMEKQMKAERERREAILRAEGEKKSTVLVAEGKKESLILEAEAEKHADGNHLQGSGGDIQIPTDANEIVIKEDGSIWADGVVVDTITLADFEDYNYLELYGDNKFRAVDGAVETEANNARLEQGYTEQSNVNVVSEMVSMITITRAYEAGQKVIQTEDSLLGRAVNDVGKV